MFCLDMKEITACLGREASMDKEIRVPGVEGGRLGRGDTLLGVCGVSTIGPHSRPSSPRAPDRWPCPLGRGAQSQGGCGKEVEGVRRAVVVKLGREMKRAGSRGSRGAEEGAR